MTWLALSDSFAYLCYGSMAIINVLLCQCGDQNIITYTTGNDK